MRFICSSSHESVRSPCSPNTPLPQLQPLHEQLDWHSSLYMLAMRMTPISMPMPKPRLQNIPTTGGFDMQDVFINQQRLQAHQPEKVVVVMGGTGTGKSRLSIDLATCFPAEIVNSDKMQVYRGLDIVTNKITVEERRGVPHHLLGLIDPAEDFTAASFCSMARAATESITGRGKLPIIVGGSNSFIEALVDCEFLSRRHYDCCFLWVDVSMPVLCPFVSDRVNRMVEKGMVREVESIFDPTHSDYSRGIRRSIGVPELDVFLRAKPSSDQETQARLLREAIRRVKRNTCALACRQLEKIIRLRNVKGWKIHRLDATQAFRKRCVEGDDDDEEADRAWENLVVGPSIKIVSDFLLPIHPTSCIPQIMTVMILIDRLLKLYRLN